MFDRIRHVVGSPKFIRTANGYLVLFWVTLVIPTLLLWSKSVLWVALLSIWANVISHYTAWLAARVEVRAEDLQGEVEDDS